MRIVLVYLRGEVLKGCWYRASDFYNHLIFFSVIMYITHFHEHAGHRSDNVIVLCFLTYVCCLIFISYCHSNPNLRPVESQSVFSFLFIWKCIYIGWSSLALPIINLSIFYNNLNAVQLKQIKESEELRLAMQPLELIKRVSTIWGQWLLLQIQLNI